MRWGASVVAWRLGMGWGCLYLVFKLPQRPPIMYLVWKLLQIPYHHVYLVWKLLLMLVQVLSALTLVALHMHTPHFCPIAAA